MNSYAGQLLVVDLSSGTIKTESLSRQYATQYIGGAGLAARYLYDYVNGQTDPLGPDNPLIFMTGPLDATTAPSSGRFVVVARSPLTGLYGEANAGNFFGPDLKLAGYDGLVILGKSPTPVYLAIRDGTVELRAAASLLGMTTYETGDAIRDELNDPRLTVAAIGPAGENLVKYAIILATSTRPGAKKGVAGRCGMGTVMGSKNLKAIAVRAGHARVMPHSPEAFSAAVRAAAAMRSGDMTTLTLRAAGTATGIDLSGLVGNVPAKYWTQGTIDVEPISGNTLVEKYPPKHVTCHACLVACGQRMAIPGGTHNLPEYETLISFGALQLNDNAESLFEISSQCDALGLDSISTGSTIALAAYLRERDVIPPPEEVQLGWGKPEQTLKLLDMIARRHGIGDQLAEGSRALATRYGVQELAVQVNGLELGMHDPRALSGMALVYTISPIGASHNHPDYYWVDEFARPIESLGIAGIGRFETEGKAVNVARYQDWCAVGASLVTCSLPSADVENTVRMLAAATGFDVTIDNVLSYGERIINLKRALNIKFNYDARANEKLPILLLAPLPDGGTEGHVPQLEPMLREYYGYRDWIWESGKPSRDKLFALGMTEIARDLWGVD